MLRDPGRPPGGKADAADDQQIAEDACQEDETVLQQHAVEETETWDIFELLGGMVDQQNEDPNFKTRADDVAVKAKT